jgi:hypothetical protein
MGNSCVQDCSTLFKDKGSEAFFDLDSEHAAALSQAEDVQTHSGDLPRLGLGLSINSPSFSGKLSLRREDGKQTSQDPLLGGEVLSHGQCQLTFDLPENASRVHETIKKTVSPEVMTNDSDTQSVFTLAPPIQDLVEAESISEPTSEPEPALQPTVPAGFETYCDPVSKGSISGGLPSLELVCEVDGKERCMLLYRKPLGAEFSTKADGLTTITKVYPRSYASELGLAPGWILKSIGADDMTNKTFEQIQRALKGGLMALPMRVKK